MVLAVVVRVVMVVLAVVVRVAMVVFLSVSILTVSSSWYAKERNCAKGVIRQRQRARGDIGGRGRVGTARMVVAGEGGGIGVGQQGQWWQGEGGDCIGGAAGRVVVGGIPLHESDGGNSRGGCGGAGKESGWGGDCVSRRRLGLFGVGSCRFVRSSSADCDPRYNALQIIVLCVFRRLVGDGEGADTPAQPSR